MFLYLDDEDWELELPVREAAMDGGRVVRRDRKRKYTFDIFKQIYDEKHARTSPDQPWEDIFSLTIVEGLYHTLSKDELIQLKGWLKPKYALIY